MWKFCILSGLKIENKLNFVIIIYRVFQTMLHTPFAQAASCVRVLRAQSRTLAAAAAAVVDDNAKTSQLTVPRGV